MKKIALAIIMLLLLSACSVKPQVGAPWMQDLLQNGPKGASPIYQQGWRDGCESGIGLVSNSLQRHFYTFKQDGYQVQNPEYYIAWKNSLQYCQNYVYQYLAKKYI